MVTGALGLRWYDAVVTGQDAHAGPTPMRLRHDAMVAAARMVTEINALAHRYQPNGRGTVGFMQVKPNSRNVIPGEVRFSVDLRHAEDAQLEKMEAEMRAKCAELAQGAERQREHRARRKLSGVPVRRELRVGGAQRRAKARPHAYGHRERRGP